MNIIVALVIALFPLIIVHIIGKTNYSETMPFAAAWLSAFLHFFSAKEIVMIDKTLGSSHFS